MSMSEKTIKTEDLSEMAIQYVKSAYLQTRSKIEQTADPSEYTSEEYATDCVTEISESLGREVTHQASKQAKHAVQYVQDAYRGEDTTQVPPYTESRYRANDADRTNSNVVLQHKSLENGYVRTNPHTIKSTDKPHQEYPDGAYSSTHETRVNRSYYERTIQQKYEVTPQRNPVYRTQNGIYMDCKDTVVPQSGRIRESVVPVEKLKQSMVRQYQEKRAKGRITSKTEDKLASPKTKNSASYNLSQSPDNRIKTKVFVQKDTSKIRSSVRYAVKTPRKGGTVAIQNKHTMRKQVMQKAARDSVARKELVHLTGEKAIKVSKKATEIAVRAVRGILKASKSLHMALTAFGWVALIIVVVVLMIGLLVGSSYGIFFSNEEGADGQSMQEVVKEMNRNFEDELQRLKAQIVHDESNVSGLRAKWTDVLAIYAVYVTADPNNPQEVATITEEKKTILADIFQQMNEITYDIETRTTQEVIENTDKQGKLVQEIVEVKKKWLIVNINSKSAQEMCDILGFTDRQKLQVEQLLDDEFRFMWMHVLYGMDSGNDMIVSVAQSQIGNVGGQPYWSWYGFPGRVEWCACFVSWCANECGYIDAGIFPKFAGCTFGMLWFKWRNQWVERDIEPTPGMIVFFDWAKNGQNGNADHVGIVSHVEDGRVYTIEGNSSDSCRERSYPIGYFEIMGYGVPDYCK